MKLGELRQQFREELQSIYRIEEVNAYFNWLCEHYLDYKSFEVVQNIQTVLSDEKISVLQKALADLKNEKPIQQILGKAYFYGLELMVNEHTLIPRPETEELVDWIIKDFKGAERLNILDIGTGSGCIPIALAKNIPNARVCAIDISEEALKVAKTNAKNNNAQITFAKADVLNIDKLKVIFPHIQHFDVIVSNPPYVRELEKSEMKNNVLVYEPATALFVTDNEPLIFYKKIAKLAKENLSSQGVLYFEINQYLGREMQSLVREQGFNNIILKNDLFGNERMLKAQK
ncbi:peptide chain release factor N(5)-glutamine methyltransferase [Galbibacter mesophilus]|uniref:peptide chain release factor N(5)-glutamine methyltransferase n=1 Tax=Galbibacter mesophilus TaxID=379069 RepID=UPI00191F77F4|nr:peptide chain release factor N(5)-glutamine methyltransferase [Galbibacter mesophilus]MCM5663789.1 peptide chain release factor N(5)-glutamine methyltransferase [Galbibacter mesophilus]